MTDVLHDLTERLRSTAEALRSGDLSPEEAAAHVDRLAGLAAEGAAELDRQARAAGQLEPRPGQTELLEPPGA
jgi:hypothetical protein